MPKKPIKKSLSPMPVPLNDRVVAIVVGIEDYQPKKVGALPPVQFARNDAKAFAEALQSIHPHAEIEILIDSDATESALAYALKQTIGGLGKDDLFVFYYAGHGFHGAGGNRITAWDSHAHHVQGTSLLLRDVLTEPLRASGCQRALAFVDACASALEELVDDRDVLSELDPAELKELLADTHYRALFLSCEPGQKSYPSAVLKHGIWTAFLLKALRGEDEEALTEQRLLTDTSLRDYLRTRVPRFITQNMQIKATQKPMAIINATNTFVIRDVPLPPVPVADTGDFSQLKLGVNREYFQHGETGAIKALPGFNKKIHYQPEFNSPGARDFVARLLTPKIDAEIQQLYESAKEVFQLKKKDTSRISDSGQGSLDTEYFRFWIESAQSKSDPSEYRVVRRLELRADANAHLEKFDDVFGRMFDRVVIEFEGVALEYDDLVDMLEEVAAQHGGKVKDEENLEKVTYIGDDGTSFSVDFKNRRLTFFWNTKKGVPDILEKLKSFRLGLAAPSLLLIG